MGRSAVRYLHPGRKGSNQAEFTIRKDVEGFTQLLDRLRKFSDSQKDFSVLIETRRSVIVDFLLQHGYQVFEINPKALDRFRERYRLSGANTDRFDAYVLADVLRTDGKRFKPLSFGTELAREIAILSTDLRRFVQEQTGLSNALKATLKEYYPVFVTLFSDVACKTALHFLQAYPTYGEARKLTLEELTQFLKAQGYHNKEASKTIYQKLQEGQIFIDPVVVRAKSRKALTLVAQLLSLLEQVKDYDQEIQRLLDQHPDREIFLSLPSVGSRLAAELLGCFGDDRNRFQHYNEVQCYSGTAPVTFSSGSYRNVCFRRACSKKFRNTMQLLAFTSIKSCLWAKKYYLARRRQGKTHNHALRCLGNKWNKIIFKMWKNRTLYDEQHHLADIAMQLVLVDDQIFSRRKSLLWIRPAVA